jgi:serine/threonine-protein kinase
MKATTDRLVLPEDVEMTPVAGLDPAGLVGLSFNDGDWVVTRVASRSRSMIISSDLAELLQTFRAPRTIIEAILRFATVHAVDPRNVLDEAWPVITRFLHTHWLVPEHSYLSRDIAPWYEPGHSLSGHTVDTCIHLADDTQAYKAHTPSYESCAIKVVDRTCRPALAALHEEERILERLAGRPGPRLIGAGDDERCRFLVMEWCDGVEAARAAVRTAGSRRAVRDLLVSILSVYATLHAGQVVHGDVHPGNLLVGNDGTVRILDFGLARVLDDPASTPRRGGAPEYFDPEYAAAALAGTSPPPATAPSEQYALAALCYRLVSGRDHLRFSPEAERFYRQIAQAPPLSFAENGAAPWPDLERVLRRSLAKSASDRFASVAAMAEAVSQVDVTERTAPSSAMPSAGATQVDRLITRVTKLVDPDNDLFTTGPATGPRATFMNGAAGIAYYLLRVAQLTGDPASLAAADQWAERAATFAREPRGVYDDSVGVGRDAVGEVSPYHTASGVELVRGLVAHARGDLRTLVQAAGAYLDLVDRPYGGVDPTLGVTGVLTGCSHLLRCLLEAEEATEATGAAAERLIRHGNAVADLVVRQAIDTPEVVVHTGAAHGWAGVLYTLMTWRQVTGGPLDGGVVDRLGDLAGQRLPNGRGVRWPVRTDQAPPSFMNSWCNGPPGQVYLWNAAQRIQGDTTFGEVAAAAAFATYDEPGPNTTLCCGQAGQIFALLNMHRHSQDEAWLRLASDRLQTAVDHDDADRTGPWSHSLYRGEVGLALAAMEIMYPAEARHPLFE